MEPPQARGRFQQAVQEIQGARIIGTAAPPRFFLGCIVH